MEQDDQCPGGDVAVYHKSLLYLVARALEPNPNPVTGMVPLVGLRSDSRPRRRLVAVARGTLLADGAKIVIAPGGTPPDPRSDARGHGDFDDDRATMTSVLLRMLDVTEPPAGSYVPNDPIHDLPAAPPSGAQLRVAPAVEARTARGRGGRSRPSSRPAAGRPPGARSGGPDPAGPRRPRCTCRSRRPSTRPSPARPSTSSTATATRRWRPRAQTACQNSRAVKTGRWTDPADLHDLEPRS